MSESISTDSRIEAAATAINHLYRRGFPRMEVREALLSTFFPFRIIESPNGPEADFSTEKKQAALDLATELRAQALPPDERDTLIDIQRIRQGGTIWER